MSKTSADKSSTKPSCCHMQICIWKKHIQISNVQALRTHVHKNTLIMVMLQKSTTPGTDGVALWGGYSWLAWEEETGGWQVCYFISVCLCHGAVKMFKLNTTALFLFLSFSLSWCFTVKVTAVAWIIVADCSMKGLIFCPIVCFICQSVQVNDSFQCLLSV